MENYYMTIEIIQAVRITQILKDEGWLFIDDGSNDIRCVVNSSYGEEIKFEESKDFVSWLHKQVERYLM